MRNTALRTQAATAAVTAPSLLVALDIDGTLIDSERRSQRRLRTTTKFYRRLPVVQVVVLNGI
jgi:hypothetical protein